MEGQQRPVLLLQWSSKHRYVGKTCRPIPAERSCGMSSSVLGMRLNFCFPATSASSRGLRRCALVYNSPRAAASPAKRSFPPLFLCRFQGLHISKIVCFPGVSTICCGLSTDLPTYCCISHAKVDQEAKSLRHHDCVFGSGGTVPFPSSVPAGSVDARDVSVLLRSGSAASSSGTR